ncbi:hypothetical protein [Aureispira anguillae]|uniref:Uncharacterized protein n=1 Tax=Aureispira anguillae TaxID=2864201 RepID=A0A916DUU0_9BACT|nr:hypothetical protein [Aureispira anguillae]BDS12820.1 hypothetical protein AsAng_0035450 [Aureispira anguillae]
MKRLILSTLLSMFAFSISAQSLNDVALDKIESNYIRVVSNQDESDIYIDFGTHYNAPRFSNRLADPKLRNVIKNKEGHEVIFASVIDALNFMDNNGYILIETHTIIDNEITMFHYLMKKKK